MHQTKVSVLKVWSQKQIVKLFMKEIREVRLQYEFPELKIAIVEGFIKFTR